VIVAPARQEPRVTPPGHDRTPVTVAGADLTGTSPSVIAEPPGRKR
jgi:hypothetical protein